MPVLCPACKSELDPQATRCEVCMRERTRQEMIAGLRVSDKPKTNWKFLLWLAVAAAIAPFAFKSFRFVESPFAARPAKAPERAAASVPAPAAPPSVPEDARSLPGPERTTPLSSLPGDGEKTRPPLPARWTIHGEAYDLLTLAPVAGLTLSLENPETGKVFTTRTDARGVYSLTVPGLADAGYRVSVSGTRYRNGYLEDAGLSYKDRSRAHREEAAELARVSKVLHVPVNLAAPQDRLKYDLALLP
ncbi:MAG: carboxypeptidase-like regulatory domain-containing protein [Elusimicrobiota bacterium]|jgi:hypothetical protein